VKLKNEVVTSDLSQKTTNQQLFKKNAIDESGLTVIIP
jgi:hypothetical protein